MTQPGSNEKGYIFGATWYREQQRLQALETIWDGYTQENFAALDIDLTGKRCLEVGAGSGSIAAWLCERAGPDGSVVATDIDTRFLEAIEASNLDVRRHDICAETLEPQSFDVVHTRLVLEHLPESRTALQHMIAALKPGGWLLLEEFDHVSFLPDPGSSDRALGIWSRFMAAFEHLAGQRGLDLSYGRRMFGLLCAAGMEDVSAVGRTYAERGGVEERALLRLSLESGFGDAHVATGLIDREDLDGLIALLNDPHFCWSSQIMVAAKGRRPL